MKKEKYKYEIDFSLPVKNTTSEVIAPFHNKPPFLPTTSSLWEKSEPHFARIKKTAALLSFFKEGVGDSNCVTRARKETFATDNL